MKAIISDIKHFAVHDGDGIRTTVFFKGCPLKCVWCHNPESISNVPQVAYYHNKCLNCGECVSSCKNLAHLICNNSHFFNRNLCAYCGQCENFCLGDALKLYGKEMSIEEILPILLKDKDFYESSGGGVTLSGGECLLQADFCAELLKELKKHSINTAVDTCGFVSRESFDKVLAYTDTFLYDIKAINVDVHIKCTGQGNKIILDNLKYLDTMGKKIEIRIPYVPDYNDNQISKIADYLNNFKNITKVKILPYHNYAGSKYAALNIKNTLPQKLPTEQEIICAQNLFC